MLRSTGSTKQLPCSRHMLGPGGAEEKEGSGPCPHPISNYANMIRLMIWFQLWACFQSSRGPAHSACEGRPTQAPSSERSLLHDSSGSKEMFSDAAQPVPIPGLRGPRPPALPCWRSPVPPAPALRRGANHTEDSASEFSLLLFTTAVDSLLSSLPWASAFLPLSRSRGFCLWPLSLSEVHHHATVSVPLCGSCIQTPSGSNAIGPIGHSPLCSIPTGWGPHTRPCPQTLTSL